MNPYPDTWLPEGIRSRFVSGVNGLDVHVLEAGFERAGAPCVLLLHGFPELAYSWRNVMRPLADAGYHVVAPDQRGYGRTTGWRANYEGDISEYRALNLVRDALGLVYALGHHHAGVVGHDFGSGVAAWSTIVRPDVFTRVAVMSGPFSGTGEIPFGTATDAGARENPPGPGGLEALDAELARLARPRKHYVGYYRMREANEDMWHGPAGVHGFLRGYFHYKSADWPGNRPFRLESAKPEEMARMPTYYVMALESDMADTVAGHMPSPAAVAANTWLPESALAVSAEEFGRTGFQGGLNWYRTFGAPSAETELFAGRTIDQPCMYIAGKNDWGTYQRPGALERMRSGACTRLLGVHLVDGAGHWVQQEQPDETARLLIDLLSA